MSARSVASLALLLLLPCSSGWGQAITPAVPPPSAVGPTPPPAAIVAPPPGSVAASSIAAGPFTQQQVQEIRTLCSRAADWTRFSVCLELRPASP